MPDHPNLLVVMTDQQRADSLGCLGNRAVATPHLDRLAHEGVLFENAWCTNPICTPSRASFLTGHHLPRHGVETISGELRPEEVLFPERLRAAGYRTGLVGKLHTQSGAIESQRRHPHDGFDVYDLYYGGGAMMGSPLNAYAPWVKERRPDVYERLVEHEKAAGPIPAEVHMNAWAAERAEAFLDEAAGTDRPWFLMVSVFDPHNPYDDHPPEEEARVDTAGLAPLIPPPATGEAPAGVERHARDNYFGDAAEMTPEEVERMRVGYHAEVGMIDDLVGELLAQLDARGLAGDTLVLFLSDHGDLLGDHALLVKGPVVVRREPPRAGDRPVAGKGRAGDAARRADPAQRPDGDAAERGRSGRRPARRDRPAGPGAPGGRHQRLSELRARPRPQAPRPAGPPHLRHRRPLDPRPLPPCPRRPRGPGHAALRPRDRPRSAPRPRGGSRRADARARLDAAVDNFLVEEAALRG